jgi:hypothetical protein
MTLLVLLKSNDPVVIPPSANVASVNVQVNTVAAEAVVT